MFYFLRYIVFTMLIVFSIIFAQVGTNPAQILKQIGISEQQAKDIIQKELGVNANDVILPNDDLEQQVDVNEIKKIIESDEVIKNNEIVDVKNILDDSFDEGTEKNDWNPPSPASKNIDNLLYKFENILYKFNGKSWVVDDSANKKTFEDKQKNTNITTYFGYNSFSKNSKIFDESLLGNVDPGYVLGPGDEVILMLWGQTELNKPYIITKDGYIFIEALGQVFVNGLTLEKLEQKLFKLLKRVYSSLDNSSGNASTYFDISLGKTLLKPTRVFVMGEVENPGAYNLSHSATLFSSIFNFGGPKTSGSLREISLIRDGKVVGSIDFYDFLLSGKKNNDLGIQRNDIIYIKPRGKTVDASGEILRPFFFELKEGEDLTDLIDMAGGLLSTTYRKRVQIDRIIDPEKRRYTIVDRKIIDFDLSNFNKGFKADLYDGDKVTFFKISDTRSSSVNLVGDVARPGLYALKKGMTIVDLINTADGVLGTAYMQKVDITRLNSDFTTKLIDIDLNAAFEGQNSNNIFLLDNDSIKVYNKSEMTYKAEVSIEGHVFEPGVKKFKIGMTVYDLIFEGGGFENKMHLKNTHLEKSELSRIAENGIDRNLQYFRLDSVLVGQGMANNEIKMGDKIRIYSREEVRGSVAKFVEIKGVVKRPGSYPFSDGMGVRDILFMAGGFDDPVFLTDVFMERSDIVRYEDDLLTKKVVPFSLKKLLNVDERSDDIPLFDKDIIRIYSSNIFRKIKFVQIEGEVENPGSYELKNNMTISDLILESGGIKSENIHVRVDVASKNLPNQSLNKKNNINEYFNIETFIMKNIKNSFITNNRAKSFLLKPDDILHVRADPDIINSKVVKLSGLVKYPGDYIINNTHEKISDIIKRAGGILPNGNPKASYISRSGERINLSFEKLLQSSRSKTNVVVLDGDEINIGEFSNLVVIEGAVNNPGNYQFINGLRLSAYVKKAGGFSKDASRYSSFVVHADGTSKRVSLFKFSPNIYDGSKIFIGTKAEVEKFNFTQYVQSFTEIWADITQAYILIRLASGN